jgi:fructuronate reductase
MKLTYEGIKNRAFWEDRGFVLPEFDPETLAEKTAETPEWVHFGAGNIFRAYLAHVAQKAINAGALKTGIIAVEGFDPEIITKIYRPHDNLSIYLTWTASGDAQKTLIGSVSDSLILCNSPENSSEYSSGNSADNSPENSADNSLENLPAVHREDYAKLKKIFTAPSLKIATFTITEKGYALSGKDGFFPDVAADLESTPDKAKSYLGMVSALLYERFLKGLPLAMVSADNCAENGEKLKNCIRTFAETWEINGLIKSGFLRYINDKISFPVTMIDKITPRPNPDFARVLTLDEIEGMNPLITAKKTYIAPFTNAEESEYFIVEDDFPNGRLALENFGVIYTDKSTVKLTEKMKVSALLNPIHTALALFGCLLSYTKISDEMRDLDLHSLAEKLCFDECLPTVADPVIINPREFAETVINVRLQNPFLPDSPQRIASDTSQKLAVRFGETVKFYLQEGSEKKLKFIPLVYAGFLRYLLAVDDSGEAFELSADPLSDYLSGFAKEIKIGEEYSEKILREHFYELLSNEKIFGLNIAETPLFEKIIAYFKLMSGEKNSVRNTIKSAISEG